MAIFTALLPLIIRYINYLFDKKIAKDRLLKKYKLLFNQAMQGLIPELGSASKMHKNITDQIKQLKEEVYEINESDKLKNINNPTHK
jgi:hypothetical protein